MWIVVIIAVLALLFLIGKNSIDSVIKNRITLNGGMLAVYNTLVEGILEDESARILGVGGNSINLGVINFDGSTTFRIVQLYETVTVEWKVSSKIYGNHVLRWEFPNGLDQNKMLSTITSHISNYNKKLILKQIPESAEEYNETIASNVRTKNIEIIARSFNCDRSMAKKIYFNKMDELNSTEKDLEQLFNHLSKNVINEARINKISPRDTQSGILYEWSKEYAENKKINTTAIDIDIISDLYDSDPSLLIELLEAKKNGKQLRFEQLLAEHPEHINLFITKMAEKEKKNNCMYFNCTVSDLPI